MGVFICCDADAKRIPRDEWKGAFADAMRIAEAGKLSNTERREYEGYRYYAGVPCTSEEVEKNDGLRIDGELETGSSMETHYIPRSLGVDVPEQPEGTMLAGYLSEPEKYGLEIIDSEGILFNKTQGRLGHIWLLSMACVFCDRFPDAMYLGGDITAGQVKRAMEIAEEVLDRKLAPPVAFDKGLLLPRVHELSQGNEAIEFQLFSEIYKGMRDDAYNSFVLEHFSQHAIYSGYRELAKEDGIHEILKQWLLLDLPFRDVAQMLVADPEGPKHPPEKFVKSVLNAKLHIEEKLIYDAAHADNANEVPDDIEMLLSRTMAMMFGIRNWAIDRYIPLNQLKTDCKDVFGDGCDVETLFKDAEESIANSRSSQTSKAIYDIIEKQTMLDAEEEAEYDINEMEQMFWWKPDVSTNPTVLDGLTKTYAKMIEVTNNIYAQFVAAGRRKRIEILTGYGGQYLLLPEDKWKDIFANMMDDEKMLRYISTFGVDRSSDNISMVVRILLYNDALYEEIARRVKEMVN